MKPRYGSIRLALIGVGLTLLSSAGAMAAGFSYQAVAFLDTKAPGGGKLVNDFEPGAISGKGEIAFVVDYDPPGKDSEGLYLASEGKLIPIVEPGKAAVPDWTFVAGGDVGMIISPVAMNAAGDISFGSDIQKKGDSNIVAGIFLWKRQTGQLVAVALPGADAPGGGKFGNTKGHTWTDVNDQGDVAFSMEVPAAGGVDQGVFVRTADGKLQTIARPGDKSPEGSVFNRARRPNINNAGDVAFEGRIDKDGASGIYLSQAGKIKLIAGPDTVVTGGKLAEVQGPRLNNKGEVIFLGRTDAGWGLYRMAEGKLSAVAQPGATLRDGAKLGEVQSKDGSLSLADSGDIAVRVRLDSNGGDAVYLVRGDQILPVVRAGTDLAGVGTVDDAESEHVAVNNLGQVAFQAKLKDGRTALVLATPLP